jgi:hypothetical protein
MQRPFTLIRKAASLGYIYILMHHGPWFSEVDLLDDLLCGGLDVFAAHQLNQVDILFENL